MSKAIRDTGWSIGPDRSEEASPPVRQVECTTCRERSEECTSQLGPDAWALRHAALSGHDGYRETVTALLRVTPAPGAPADRKRTAP
ncbi:MULTISPECIES: DUF7848 domain-containing protein [unclassified Streptomyces]|uniref:DUF7848 domain-containing protein n=1 Tax=unclassified Streptomyces TaxID=2593676 RepID=UPI00093FEB8E|nr:hypothetical protein [Streptomyces sp. CB01580]OKJ31769.1 hypothetical protein AMK22_24775 [Streptomyces sp. CB01580]